MSWKVLFSPKAESQLVSLYGYIADVSCPETAAAFLERLVSYCESLAVFPIRGRLRDDIREGLRITHYKHRTVIAFVPDGARRTVTILGVFYGGRDYAGKLQRLHGARHM